MNSSRDFSWDWVLHLLIHPLLVLKSTAISLTLVTFMKMVVWFGFVHLSVTVANATAGETMKRKLDLNHNEVAIPSFSGQGSNEGGRFEMRFEEQSQSLLFQVKVPTKKRKKKKLIKRSPPL
ncbi:MAG: hypothetical protein DRG83_02815 [Deltaproteobacteria bacterium]|nr:MAG: hypothetical protein DRG83_02815 [Deltaproteobacteria bacterium]